MLRTASHYSTIGRRQRLVKDLAHKYQSESSSGRSLRAITALRQKVSFEFQLERYLALQRSIRNHVTCLESEALNPPNATTCTPADFVTAWCTFNDNASFTNDGATTESSDRSHADLWEVITLGIDLTTPVLARHLGQEVLQKEASTQLEDLDARIREEYICTQLNRWVQYTTTAADDFDELSSAKLGPLLVPEDYTSPSSKSPSVEYMAIANQFVTTLLQARLYVSVAEILGLDDNLELFQSARKLLQKYHLLTWQQLSGTQQRNGNGAPSHAESTSLATNLAIINVGLLCGDKQCLKAAKRILHGMRGPPMFESVAVACEFAEAAPAKSRPGMQQLEKLCQSIQPDSGDELGWPELATHLSSAMLEYRGEGTFDHATETLKEVLLRHSPGATEATTTSDAEETANTSSFVRHDAHSLLAARVAIVNGDKVACSGVISDADESLGQIVAADSLCFALRQGQIEFCDLTFEFLAKPGDQSEAAVELPGILDWRGNNALHAAAAGGHIASVEWLAARNLTCTRLPPTHDAPSPLLVACFHGHTALMSLFLEQLDDVDKRAEAAQSSPLALCDKRGWGVSHFAAAGGNASVIDKACDLAAARSDHETSHDRNLEAIVNCFGARDNRGLSPFIVSAMVGNFHFIEEACQSMQARLCALSPPRGHLLPRLLQPLLSDFAGRSIWQYASPTIFAPLGELLGAVLGPQWRQPTAATTAATSLPNPPKV